MRRTDCLLEPVTAVVANIVSQHAETCHFCKNEDIRITKICKSRMAKRMVSKLPVAVDSSKPPLQVTQESCDTVSSEYTLFTLPCQQSTPLQANLKVDAHTLKWKLIQG